MESKFRYEKYINKFNKKGIALLKHKRKITQEEFNKRLPYFHSLKNNNKYTYQKFKNYNINNNYINISSYNNDIPLDKILLSDLNIIYERIKDFKYTPLKLFEMIKESEKFRGVDFNIQYSQINNKKYWYKCEVTIFSQK